jgi:hypothetical protein
MGVEKNFKSNKDILLEKVNYHICFLVNQIHFAAGKLKTEIIAINWVPCDVSIHVYIVFSSG